MEYRIRVERLLWLAAQLAESLVLEAPSDFSREFYSRSSSELQAKVIALQAAVNLGADREACARLAYDVKRVLDYIAVSHAKGEIPLSRSDWLRECMTLVYVFQESKYAAVGGRRA